MKRTASLAVGLATVLSSCQLYRLDPEWLLWSSAAPYRGERYEPSFTGFDRWTSEEKCDYYAYGLAPVDPSCLSGETSLAVKVHRSLVAAQHPVDDGPYGRDNAALGEACGAMVTFDWQKNDQLFYGCYYPYLSPRGPDYFRRSQPAKDPWFRPLFSGSDHFLLSYADFLAETPECWRYGLSDTACMSLLLLEVTTLCGVQLPGCGIAFTGPWWNDSDPVPLDNATVIRKVEQ